MSAKTRDPVAINRSSAFDADALHDADTDDGEEWEYEYSSTETETYYLTVDLSIPNFTRQVVHHDAVTGRQGHQKGRKVFPIRREESLSDEERPGNQGNGGPNDLTGEHQSPQRGNADGEKRPASRAGKGKDAVRTQDVKNKAKEQRRKEASEIQILELHSKQPLISYRGRFFEGSWGENIGTEMLFAKHDTRRPLPALKTLEGGVDVLAASAARILTTEKKLVPKARAPTASADDALFKELAKIRQENNIHFPVAFDGTGERREQARFLENLQALKKKRGEIDEVTVTAVGVHRDDLEHEFEVSGSKKRRKHRQWIAKSGTVAPIAAESHASSQLALRPIVAEDWGNMTDPAGENASDDSVAEPGNEGSQNSSDEDEDEDGNDLSGGDIDSEMLYDDDEEEDDDDDDDDGEEDSEEGGNSAG